MNRKAYLAIAFGMWFGTAEAQERIRVTHITNPEINFAELWPGTDVPNKEGFTFGHDVHGWFMWCTNPYLCKPDTPVIVHTFSPGQIIRQPYPTFRGVVVSVAVDQGSTIVTARIIQADGVPRAGEYIAFDASRTQWYPANELP